MKKRPAKKARATTKAKSVTPETRVSRFLTRHGANYRDIDIDTWTKRFCSEMENGLAGKKSSLKMIPTYIEVDTEHELPVDKKVIVLDAGGTNFRVSTVRFDASRNPVVENFTTHRMPGIERELAKDEFYAAMSAHVRAVADVSDSISFCFSYPVEMFPSKDGKLMHWTKEVKAKAVEGSFIGEGLTAALAANGASKKNIVILNDTVATLLAGRSVSGARQYGSYIGFILGTGTNTSYVEANRNITKVKGLDAKRSQCINIEMGGMNVLPHGDLDDALDATTQDKGNYRLEKIVSGRYLGPLALLAVHAACREGLFSPAAATLLSSLTALETKDINDFISMPNDTEYSLSRLVMGDDARTLWHLFDMLVSRSAAITAINLASVVIRSGAGTDPLAPVGITAEGTTFHRLAGLKQKTERFLGAYLREKKGIYYDILTVENATLIGTAVAGLMN
ncbi:MAG: hexokinase [Spirochaetota bacterium]